MDKNFTEIQLGRGVAHKLTNAHMREAILGRVKKILGGRELTDIREHKMSSVTRITGQTIMKLKLDSAYMFLYITNWNGIILALYITDITVYNVTMRLGAYRGDRLFGVYVCDRECLVDDVFIDEGRHVAAVTGIEQRLKIMNSFIDHDYRHDPVLDVFKLRVLEHVEGCYWQSYLRDYVPMQCYSNAVIGYVIYSLINGDIRQVDDMPMISMDAQPDLQERLQIRAPVNPYLRVCFLMEYSGKPDVYNLYLLHERKLVVYDIASVPNKSTSRHVVCMYERPPVKGDKILVVCEYDPEFRRWKPVERETRRTLPDTPEILDNA